MKRGLCGSCVVLRVMVGGMGCFEVAQAPAEEAESFKSGRTHMNQSMGCFREVQRSQYP